MSLSPVNRIPKIKNYTYWLFVFFIFKIYNLQFSDYQQPRFGIYWLCFSVNFVFWTYNRCTTVNRLCQAWECICDAFDQVIVTSNIRLTSQYVLGCQVDYEDSELIYCTNLGLNIKKYITNGRDFILLKFGSARKKRENKRNQMPQVSGPIGRALVGLLSKLVQMALTPVTMWHLQQIPQKCLWGRHKLHFDGQFCVNNCYSWSSEIVLFYVKKFYIWRSRDISSLIFTFWEGSSLYCVFTVVRLSSKTPRLFRSDMTHECALQQLTRAAKTSYQDIGCPSISVLTCKQCPQL